MLSLPGLWRAGVRCVLQSGSGCRQAPGGAVGHPFAARGGGMECCDRCGRSGSSDGRPSQSAVIEPSGVLNGRRRVYDSTIPADGSPRSTDTSGMGSVILVWPGVEGLEGDGAVHSVAGMASSGLYQHSIHSKMELASSSRFAILSCRIFRVAWAPEGFHQELS